DFNFGCLEAWPLCTGLCGSGCDELDFYLAVTSPHVRRATTEEYASWFCPYLKAQPGADSLSASDFPPLGNHAILDIAYEDFFVSPLPVDGYSNVILVPEGVNPLGGKLGTIQLAYFANNTLIPLTSRPPASDDLMHQCLQPPSP